MDADTLSTCILVASAAVVYYDFWKFFRKGRFPYFIGRPHRGLAVFIPLEMAAALAMIAVEVIPLIAHADGRIFGIIAGVAEEPGKLLPIIYLCRRNRFFREYVRNGGWFYVGILAGLGFGIFEGILYTIGILTTVSDFYEAFLSIVLGRMAVVGLHAVFTVIAAWGYSRFLNGSRRAFAASLGVAIVMHSTYDFLVYSSYITGNGLHALLASAVYPLAVVVYFLLKRGVVDFYERGDVSWVLRVFIVR